MIGRGAAKLLLAVLALNACQLPPSPEEIRRQQQEEVRARRDARLAAQREARRATNARREANRAGERRRAQAEATERNRKPEAERTTAQPRAAERQDEVTRPRPVYEALTGGKVGCRNPRVVNAVRVPPDNVTESMWNWLMEEGGCLPAIPGPKWVELRYEAPLRLLQMIPDPSDRDPGFPIQLWFNEADVRINGQSATPG